MNINYLFIKKGYSCRYLRLDNVLELGQRQFYTFSVILCALKIICD